MEPLLAKHLNSFTSNSRALLNQIQEYKKRMGEIRHEIKPRVVNVYREDHVTDKTSIKEKY
jgi:hypothetical protein